MIFVFILLVIILMVYLYSIRNFNYWRNKGIKYNKPLPIVGNYANVCLMRRSLSQLYSEIYNKYRSEKVVGLFRSSYPELIIRDPSLVKRILATDFQYFYIRKVIDIDEPSEPLYCHIFNANGDSWKLLRQRLSSAFTSSKLKAMFPLIVERTDGLHKRIQNAREAPIEATDLMARFATDFIGACGFGLDADSLNEEDSEFRKIGKKIFNVSTIDTLKYYLKHIFPDLFRSLNVSSHLDDVLPFVQSILKQRDSESFGRNDFVDLLLQCKREGTIVGQSIEKLKEDGTAEIATLEMTDTLIAAQMFLFFVAGFETSSFSSSFTLHQLAHHPNEQKKVQEEIDKVLSEYDNKLCFEAVKNMHYLEWAYKESLRMLPPVGFLLRDCARTYKFPDLDLTIEKGVRVVIPVMAMQNDPHIFENPDIFDPERFSPGKIDIHKTKYAYLPFGEGPRSCIGGRLGLMQTMAGLAAVLSNFTVEPAPDSKKHPTVICNPEITQQVKGGLPLLFRERKKFQ